MEECIKKPYKKGKETQRPDEALGSHHMAGRLEPDNGMFKVPLNPSCSRMLQHSKKKYIYIYLSIYLSPQSINIPVLNTEIPNNLFQKELKE